MVTRYTALAVVVVAIVLVIAIAIVGIACYSAPIDKSILFGGFSIGVLALGILEWVADEIHWKVLWIVGVLRRVDNPQWFWIIFWLTTLGPVVVVEWLFVITYFK